MKLTNAKLSHYFHNANQCDVYINFISFPERAAYMFTGCNLVVVVVVVFVVVVVVFVVVMMMVVVVVVVLVMMVVLVMVVVCGSASLQTIFRQWQITEYEYGTW